MIQTVIACSLVIIVAVAAAIGLCGCIQRKRQSNKFTSVLGHGAGESLREPSASLGPASTGTSTHLSTTGKTKGEQSLVTEDETNMKSLALQSTTGLAELKSPLLVRAATRYRNGTTEEAPSLKLQPGDQLPSTARSEHNSYLNSKPIDPYATFFVTNAETNPFVRTAQEASLSEKDETTLGWLQRQPDSLPSVSVKRTALSSVSTR